MYKSILLYYHIILYIILTLHTHTIKHSLTKYPNSSLKKSNLTFLSKPISHQIDKEDILINDDNE